MAMGDTYSMRIWLDPARMAQYGLIPSDVTSVLGEQNLEAPTGSLGENSKNVYQYTMKYTGRLKSEEEFQNIVIRSMEDGSVLRLKDVANVELGTLTYSFASELNGKPAVAFMAFQVPGSNATEVNKNITAEIQEIGESLPTGVEFVTMMSTNDFLFESIHNVVETLIVAILLVILVVELIVIVALCLVFHVHISRCLVQIPLLLLLMFVYWIAYSMMVSPLSALSKDFANLLRTLTTPLFWLSGIFFHLDSLPHVAQVIMYFNPVAWFVQAFRDCFVYRQWIWDRPEQLAVFVFTFVLTIVLAIRNYRRLREVIPDVI